MKERIISAIIFVPLLIFLIYLGGIWLFLLILAASLYGYEELSKLITGLSPKIRPYRPIGYAGIFLFLLSFYFQSHYLFIFFITFLIFTMVIRQLVYNYEAKLNELSITLLCVFYITWTFGFLLAVRSLPGGFFYLLILLFIIWGTDTGAYFFGLSFGKTSLAPNISPKKSVEGSIGGCIVSVVVALVFGASTGFSILIAILTGIVVSVTAQLGDLMVSVLKRKAFIEDTGNLIPGHGGLLDRFDSFLLAPAFYYLILVCFVL